MTYDEIEAVFEKYEDDFIRFERIPESERLHRRPDICAFLKLDQMSPGTTDIVCWAGHDEIAVDVDLERCDALTEADIVYLIRCGCRFDDGGIRMFV
jgi:hypothetical protein